VTRIRNAGDLDGFCDFSKRFLTDESGRPLVIEPFQRQVLADYSGRGWRTDWRTGAPRLLGHAGGGFETLHLRNRNGPPKRAVPGVLQGGEICVYLCCLWEVAGIRLRVDD
jgi:hypothetical protein